MVISVSFSIFLLVETILINIVYTIAIAYLVQRKALKYYLISHIDEIRKMLAQLV